MKPALLLAAVGLFAVSTTQAAVKGEQVEYTAGGTVLKGYIAYDEAIPGRRPGVLVVHEWWGHNDFARDRARRLATLGYTALAVDMYGGGRKADHPQDAKKFSSEVRSNLPLAKQRFAAARQVLNRHATVDRRRIAAVGYCFGGAVVLEMARLGEPLQAVVSVHGNLDTQNPARVGQVTARLLVLNGADDVFVKPEQIEAFKKEMTNAKVDYKFVSYPGARHAFSNPGADARGKQFNLPLAYNAEADKQSWAEMQAFLADVLGK